MGRGERAHLNVAWGPEGLIPPWAWGTADCMDEETATLRRGQVKMMMMKNISVSNEGVAKNSDFLQAR